MTAAVVVSWSQYAGLVGMFAGSCAVVVVLTLRWLRERRDERATRNVIELRPRVRR